MSRSTRIVPVGPPSDGAAYALALASFTGFIRTLRHIRWFARVGQDLTADEAGEIRDYLSKLGLGTPRVSVVRGWRDAEAVTRDPDWNRQWWDAEETLRVGLLNQALRRWGEHAAMSALTQVTDEATRVTLEAAAAAAARDGVDDPALTRVASGAATQAAYQAALASKMGEDALHPFATKFHLFWNGHWLLGLVGDTFHVF